MNSQHRRSKTVDEVILDVLGFEFPPCDPQPAERKIKERLRYYRLGPCQQARVDRLRAFKNDVQQEILLRKESRYFLGQTSRFVSIRDFDLDRLIGEYARAYPDIPEPEISSFIPFAVHLYYEL